MKNLVIQFAKWPIAGQVKTRLAKDIGDEEARQVHMRLMHDTCHKLLSEGRYHQALSLSEIQTQWPSELSPIKQLSDTGTISLSTQCKGDLGHKMAQAIQEGLRDYDKVVIVGSDCPTVDQDYVLQAFEALESSDIVLGPAEDGGYVLIGAKRFDPKVLEAVRWGTESVREQTLKHAESAQLSVAQLSLAWDVDELADYQRWCEAVN